jgi:hypothetical protein
MITSSRLCSNCGVRFLVPSDHPGAEICVRCRHEKCLVSLVGAACDSFFRSRGLSVGREYVDLLRARSRFSEIRARLSALGKGLSA